MFKIWNFHVFNVIKFQVRGHRNNNKDFTVFNWSHYFFLRADSEVY